MFSVETIETILILKMVWLAVGAVVFVAAITFFYRFSRSNRQRTSHDSQTTVGDAPTTAGKIDSPR